MQSTAVSVGILVALLSGIVVVTLSTLADKLLVKRLYDFRNLSLIDAAIGLSSY